MKKIIFLLTSLILLYGCVQSTAMLGPALTAASTGNIFQAGLSYGTNLTIKEKTGKSPSEHVVDYNKKKVVEKELQKLNYKTCSINKKKNFHNNKKIEKSLNLF